jgi:serine-aspartate repeat-containing protein C/D/E
MNRHRSRSFVQKLNRWTGSWFRESTQSSERSAAGLFTTAGEGISTLHRRTALETLEPRCLFHADPIWVGGVYVEEDAGSDAHGDSFYITFRGGAADTKLTRLVINTDQGSPGYSVADNLFDVMEDGRGADYAHAMRIESLVARHPDAKVFAQVSDGGMQLVLTFENFFAGDRLHFSIDVDEVQHLYSVNDIAAFNEGLDPITSGAEFEGSTLTAEFIAPRYADARVQGAFLNRYDASVAPSGLSLPADNEAGRRDRTAGVAVSVAQQVKPVSLAGTVFVDSNTDLLQGHDESGIAGVSLELYRLDGSTYVPTGYRTTTDREGRYAFGLELELPPGTYQIRETQPIDYWSVAAIPGKRDGLMPLGRSLDGNADILTEIALLQGDSRGTELNFAEVQPARIGGFVYRDNNNDGRKQPDELGIEGVELHIVSISTVTGTHVSQAVRTTKEGSYQFLGLPPGVYQITETQPVGFFDGKEAVGRVGTMVRGEASTNDRISGIELRSDEVGVEYNFGEIAPGSLSGHVGIGLQGFPCFSSDPSGKQSLEGVMLTLVDATGKTVATTSTQSDGGYRFENLPIGIYSILETQPEGLIDGASKAGTIGGVTVGIPLNGTRIEAIPLWGGDQGIGFDFCERLPSSISGNVFADVDADGALTSMDRVISGVVIELFNDQNQRLATTRTDADGNYRFGLLSPGRYTIRQTQPSGYFQGGQSTGSLGGDGTIEDVFAGIDVLDGQEGVRYDFREIPPASIAGYVFQDGDTLSTEDGLPPSSWSGIREGWRTPDDLPIAGVILELRRVDGTPLEASDVLPGVSVDGGFKVMTDAEGAYRFEGLRPGVYHIYETQPAGYFDGLDTPGSTGGFADNPSSVLSPIDRALIDFLRSSPSTDPGSDAILSVRATAMTPSVGNHFSEVRVVALPPREPPPREPDAPEPPLVTPVPLPEVAAPHHASPLSVSVTAHLEPRSAWMVFASMPESEPVPSIAGYPEDYTWHLSIINAGEPRGYQDRKTVDRAMIASSARMLNLSHWSIDTLNRGRWNFVSSHRNKVGVVSREAFSARGATQLAGDFNGDGHDELALFQDGEWLIDINGNGQWDRSDLWAKMGGPGDLPVVGDWDGDGKDDIGIWGVERAGDMAALEREPGLPDPENTTGTQPKNLPPTDSAEEMTVRLMQRSASGEPRSDVIDHVFRFGSEGDQPVAGDFNGDGVSSLGIFRGGRWLLDVNGDGRFDTEHDTLSEFGQAGDIAIVGDFNGDGLDEIAVVRGNQVIVDSNGNGKLDITDRVFELQGDGDGVVVGDFDGDGIDEAAFYTIDREGGRDPMRQAKAG